LSPTRDVTAEATSSKLHTGITNMKNTMLRDKENSDGTPGNFKSAPD